YPSGTTGVAKGATLTHRNLLFQTHAYFADIDKLGPGDAILHAAPLSHGSGCYGQPHIAAGAVNIVPEKGHFDAAQPEDHHLRRRADVRRRLPARHRAVRPAPVPASRTGRGADDDYGAAAVRARPAGAPRNPRARADPRRSADTP